MRKMRKKRNDFQVHIAAKLPLLALSVLSTLSDCLNTVIAKEAKKKKTEHLLEMHCGYSPGPRFSKGG